MSTVINNIKESEIPEIIAQATMNPSYWEGKLSHKTADENSQNIDLVSVDHINYAEPIFGSVIAAIASTLGKLKNEKDEKVLSFVDSQGNFICAFWIKFDGKEENGEYIAGAYFDQADLKKIEPKNIKPHTEVSYFYIEPNSEIQKFIYDSTQFEFAQDANLINRLILECLIALKFYMTINATEDGFEFHINQEVNPTLASPEFKASIGDNTGYIDLGTCLSQKVKNGVDIAFEFGQYTKYFIKDHANTSVVVE